MKFDPLKKFGTIYGISTNYPGARFEQNGYIYNSQHKCLNPQEAKEIEKDDLVALATKNLMLKKSEELKALTEEIVKAQQVLADDATAPNKTKLTKLTTKYELLVEEIESIGG